MSRSLVSLLLLSLTIACGCVERVDKPLEVDKEVAAMAGEWDMAGQFGGPAEIIRESDDPWEVRYEPGKFKHISGLCATDDEVWVCDLGLSRLQVFDFAGELKRSYGSGVPFDGTLPTDMELQARESGAAQAARWEATDPVADRWIADTQHFRAADVVVDDEGFWIADWMRTALADNAKRKPGLLLYGFDGEYIRARQDMQPFWPEYIARNETSLAYSMALSNRVLLYAEPTDKNRAAVPIGNKGGVNPMRIMDVLASAGTSTHFNQNFLRESKASREIGEFNQVGGLCFAFDKLIVCDTGNNRIQVFDARRDDDFYIGHIVRIVSAEDAAGNVRFVEPGDVDVAPDGRIYVLDTRRQEVVELSPTFQRLGIVGEGFGNAYAIDLSDDGRHLFVSDRGGQRVLHYARSD